MHLNTSPRYYPALSPSLSPPPSILSPIAAVAAAVPSAINAHNNTKSFKPSSRASPPVGTTLDSPSAAAFGTLHPSNGNGGGSAFSMANHQKAKLLSQSGYPQPHTAIKINPSAASISSAAPIGMTALPSSPSLPSTPVRPIPRSPLSPNHIVHSPKPINVGGQDRTHSPLPTPVNAYESQVMPMTDSQVVSAANAATMAVPVQYNIPYPPMVQPSYPYHGNNMMAPNSPSLTMANMQAYALPPLPIATATRTDNNGNTQQVTGAPPNAPMFAFWPPNLPRIPSLPPYLQLAQTIERTTSPSAEQLSAMMGAVNYQFPQYYIPTSPMTPPPQPLSPSTQPPLQPHQHQYVIATSPHSAAMPMTAKAPKGPSSRATTQTNQFDPATKWNSAATSSARDRIERRSADCIGRATI